MILHICTRDEWAAAQAAGSHEADTLASQGFIHCSTEEQVHVPATALFRGRQDMVLLEIDESRLPEPPRYEPGDPTDPDSPLFPHIYGPIPASAVVAVHDFPSGPDGAFTVPASVTAR
ncbi:MAG TPA: DUF952 domain-containing protein [Pseudonocardia sp.]